MIAFAKKHPNKVAVLLVLAPWWFFIANFYGFNWSTRSYPDDDFYIDAAIQSIIGTHLPASERQKKIKPAMLRYKSIEEFRERFPNCCRFRKIASSLEHFIEGVFGVYARGVSIRYEIDCKPAQDASVRITVLSYGYIHDIAGSRGECWRK